MAVEKTATTSEKDILENTSQIAATEKANFSKLKIYFFAFCDTSIYFDSVRLQKYNLSDAYKNLPPVEKIADVP